jgi:hypothetical protein
MLVTFFVSIQYNRMTDMKAITASFMNQMIHRTRKDSMVLLVYQQRLCSAAKEKTANYQVNPHSRSQSSEHVMYYLLQSGRQDHSPISHCRDNSVWLTSCVRTFCVIPALLVCLNTVR